MGNSAVVPLLMPKQRGDFDFGVTDVSNAQLTETSERPSLKKIHSELDCLGHFCRRYNWLMPPGSHIKMTKKTKTELGLYFYVNFSNILSLRKNFQFQFCCILSRF